VTLDLTYDLETDLDSVEVNQRAEYLGHHTDSLPASGLTPRLYDWSVSFEYLGFLFFVFFISLLCLVPCGRLS